MSDDGTFHGLVLRSRTLRGLTLVESQYQAGRLKRHAHASPFLSLTLNGGYCERIGSHDRESPAHHVTFHPAGEEHSLRFITASRSLNLDIEPGFLSRLPSLTQPSEWHDQQRGRLGRRIYREFLNWDSMSSVSIEAYVLEILVGIARASRSRDSVPEWHRRIVEQIRDSFRTPVSLTQLAVVAGVHPVQVARVFRRVEGCSIGDYVRRLRTEHARNELLQSHKPIAVIALEAGFADQSHLTRIMKRQLGITPHALRSSMFASRRSS